MEKLYASIRKKTGPQAAWGRFLPGGKWSGMEFWRGREKEDVIQNLINKQENKQFVLQSCHAFSPIKKEDYACQVEKIGNISVHEVPLECGCSNLSAWALK